MIIDKLENIDKYNEISNDIKRFIKNLSRDIPCGKTIINSTDYANVEIYETKEHDKCFFEAHEKFIDIQIILSGNERLDYIDNKGLVVRTPYNPDKDIVFYENPNCETCRINLDGTNFVMLFPWEAHRPQMNCTDKTQTVKKIVVKIKQ